MKLSKTKEGIAVTDAVRSLRLALGETQQSLATKLGIAISTMVRYETNRAPRGKALSMFAILAEEHGQAELAQLFRDASAAELGSWDIGGIRITDAPRTPTEKLFVSATLAVLRNAQYASEIPKLAKALQKAAKRAIEIVEERKRVLEDQKKFMAGMRELKSALEKLNESAASEESQ